MKKLLYGVGLNDATYCISSKTSKKTVFCPFYLTWKSMLSRCYGKKELKRNPTYNGCLVCNEWHAFSVFKKWMEKQDWNERQIDKDLLIQGNKIYSPETCVFVSRKVNTLLLARAADRGEWPLGVYFDVDRNGYRGMVGINGARSCLGRYITPMQAHAAWQVAKAGIIEQAANEQTDDRIENALMLRVYQLRDDLANGRETVKL